MLADDPVAHFLALGVGGALMVLLTVLCLKRPWWATITAVASVPLVPVWVGNSVSIFFVSAHMVLLALATAAVVLERRRLPSLCRADIAVALVFGLLVVGAVLRLATLTPTYTYFQWLLAYALARTAVWAYGFRRIATVIGLAYGIAAVALLVEFTTGVNVWTQYVVFGNSLFTTWSTLQSRGAVLRAEGAFGHSIAAGCSLALAAILTLDAKLRPTYRILLITLMCAAILTTVSRIGIATAAIGIGLAVVFGRSSLSARAKIATLAVGALGGLVYAFWLSDVFTDAGTEADNSAFYRFWLLDLLPYLEPFGTTAAATRTTTGELSFGGYVSVDNAVLYFALSAGWVPTLILLALLLAAVVWMLRLRAGLAGIALVATIPSLFTVALITQWALTFWLVAGLAAGQSQLSRHPGIEPETSPAHLPLPSRALMAGHQVKESSLC